jgi:7,8-dihydropterin-6-yl-methyl-4-(beta-D-ribofuranosyl)aminobenzene 5'-phosphate synthase
MSHSDIREVDAVRVWILTDNYYDALRPDSEIAKHYRATPGKSIHAEHGLAYFVETTIGMQTNSCVFDFGLDPCGVINNAQLLGVDIGKADAFILSHGHFDHWTGAAEILTQNIGRMTTKAKFYVGEEAFLPRYSRRKGSSEIIDIGQLDRTAIEACGVEIKEIRDPTQIIPGAYCTGKIERVTEYETIPPNLLVERDGKLESDDFRGEQALFFLLKDKGLIILSGCAHSGIVNTIKQVQKISGVKKIHAIIGGFHLINAEPEIIVNTVSEILAMGPKHVAPAHCTGFEAIVAFSRGMPSEFILNVAGTRYSFSAG